MRDQRHPPERVLSVDGAAFSTSGLAARNWDISPDGERVVVVVDRGSESASEDGAREEVLANWFTDLSALSGN